MLAWCPDTVQVGCACPGNITQVVRVFFNQARQHDVGVQCGIALNGVALPVQAQLLFGQVFSEQAAKLLGIQLLQILHQVLRVGHGVNYDFDSC